MLARSISAVVVVVLLVVGGGAALVIWESHERAEALAVAERDVLGSLSRLATALQTLGAAQGAYVVPGQADQPWFERVSAAIQQLYDELAALSVTTRSADAAARLQSLSTGVDELFATDVRVREFLRTSQDLMAGDIILGDGRAALDAMADEVQALTDVERDAFAAARGAAAQSGLEAAAATGAVWLVGLLVLAWRPAQSVVPSGGDVGTSHSAPAPTASAPESPALDDISEAGPVRILPKAAVDLDALTDVTAAIARVTAGDQLQPLLDRASGVLGAKGLMLWMGAGEELFPAMAAGYPARVVRQLRPLPRTDGNAAVSAWTSGRIRTVSGDGSSSGAVVAPLFGIDRAVGVLAAEVPNGHQQRADVRAAVALVAAQLAGIVPAWPDGSDRAETAPQPAAAEAPLDPAANA